MNRSIVRQLVMKDLEIMKIPVLCWWAGAIAAVVLVVLGGEVVGLYGSILFITGMAGAGIHAVMQTVVEERREQTLAFVMSLPITVREYTSAKLIANLAMFGAVWLTLSVASFVIFVGEEGMPDGTIPFVTIVLVGIFPRPFGHPCGQSRHRVDRLQHCCNRVREHLYADLPVGGR